MGGHDRPAVPVEEAEHEYSFPEVGAHGSASLTLPPAMRHSHRTSPWARTCLQARSQESLYASEAAASDPPQLKPPQEHSVMYPVDMLKVRDFNQTCDNILDVMLTAR